MHTSLKNTSYAAMFVALGLVLPFFTGQLPQLGSVLLPMHLPVLLCGFVCGWRYGLGVGLGLPLLRSLLLGSPLLVPIALAMSLELGAYGFLGGFLFDRARWHCLRMVYKCMLVALLGGRFLWGISMAMLLGLSGQSFTWKLFVMGAFVESLPGVILQLIIVPLVLVAMHRTRRGGSCN